MRIEYEIIRRHHLNRGIRYTFNVTKSEKCCAECGTLDIAAVVSTEHGDDYRFGENSFPPSGLAMGFYHENNNLDGGGDDMFFGPLAYCPFCGAKNEFLKVGEGALFEKKRTVRKTREVPVRTVKTEEYEVEEDYWDAQK